MSSIAAMGWFDAINSKATIAHFTSEKFGSLRVPIPTPEEQHYIAAFLTHIDRRVNRLIRIKRRMVALLNEQKQAIIHRAVTRGLDPDVRLKPSGVAWLGEVPEHWEVIRSKRLFSARKDLSRPDVVLKPQANVDISFFEYLFKSYGYIRALQATSDFIRGGAGCMKSQRRS